MAVHNEMLNRTRNCRAQTRSSRRSRQERRIDETDAAIDALVYRLYDLSAEEIRVVEGKEETK